MKIAFIFLSLLMVTACGKSGSDSGSSSDSAGTNPQPATTSIVHNAAECPDFSGIYRHDKETPVIGFSRDPFGGLHCVLGGVSFPVNGQLIEIRDSKDTMKLSCLKNAVFVETTSGSAKSILHIRRVEQYGYPSIDVSTDGDSYAVRYYNR